MNTADQDLWWGYSKVHGWVVLDRQVSENQPGSPTCKLFVRCSDWSIYREEQAAWEPPHYVFFRQYLARLTGEELAHAQDELARLKEEYLRCRRMLHVQYSVARRGPKEQIIARHKAFLGARGMQPGSYMTTDQLSSARRITHCYNCKEHLDNVYDLVCGKCKWIVCANCGACGCAY